MSTSPVRRGVRRWIRAARESSRWVLFGSVLVGTVGCDVAEVVLAEPDPLVVAEIYVELSPDGDRATAFLHRGLGEEELPVDGAEVVLSVDAEAFTLPAQADPADCLLENSLEAITGSCYGGPLPDGFVEPGDALSVTVTLAEGSEITGQSRIPGDFELVTPTLGTAACALAPDTEVELRWTPSGGAWAYLGETLISGLHGVIDDRGLDAELDEDPLRLTGLSVSSADTTMAYPTEFGVFDRFDLDSDVSLLLQEGLPAGTSAEVVIAATDRNYVNWVRGGNFNPSGSVRIPSLFGDVGTGVIGTYVSRRFSVETDPAENLVSCTD